MPFDPKLHVLNLAPGGTLQHTGDVGTPAGQLPEMLRALRADAAAQARPAQLTLVFHGGLVTEAQGMETARRLYPDLAENGQTWPLFVVWESGLLETLQGSLVDVVTGSPLFTQLLRKLLKHAARKLPAWATVGGAFESLPAGATDGAPAALRAQLEAERLPGDDPAALEMLEPPPDAEIDAVTDAEVRALEADLAGDKAAVAALDAILNAAQATPPPQFDAENAPGSRAPAQSTGFLSASLLEELRVVKASQPPAGVEAEFFTAAAVWAFAGQVLRNVINRYRTKTHHGLTATTLEEIYRAVYADSVGGFIWESMQENAQAAWLPLPPGAVGEGAPGGTLLLTLLQEDIARNGPLEINLIAHSAGALHACHFVENAAALAGSGAGNGAGSGAGSGLHIRTLLLLTPACTCAFFARTVLPHADAIETLRVINLEDSLERADPVVRWLPLAYPRSLLYLISGLLEEKPATPLLGLARHVYAPALAGQATPAPSPDPLLAVRTLLQADPERLLLSRTAESAPVGARAAFTGHYGATGPLRDRATLDTLAALLRPPPATQGAPLDVQVTQAVAPLMTPSPAVILGTATRVAPAGPVSADDLLAASLGRAAPAPLNPANADDEVLRLEQAGDLDETLEAIIGTNELVDHALVAGLLRAGRAVARLVLPGAPGIHALPPDARDDAWAQAAAANGLVQGFGTGWILGSARRLIITNNHVIPLAEAARAAVAEFGYERDIRTGARTQHVLRLDPDAFFLTSPNVAFGGLDYTLVGLPRPAPEELGFLAPVQGVTAARTAAIYIVQHPRGDPKAYVLNHNRKVNQSTEFVTYISDTLEGSSGAPLFDDALRLVGLHHLGNYPVKIGTRTEMTNLGSRIEAIVRDIVRQLQARNATDADLLHWFGEGVVTTAWRARSQLIAQVEESFTGAFR